MTCQPLDWVEDIVDAFNPTCGGGRGPSSVLRKLAKNLSWADLRVALWTRDRNCAEWSPRSASYTLKLNCRHASWHSAERRVNGGLGRSPIIDLVAQLKSALF